MIKQWILRRILTTPAQNTVTGDTGDQRVREFKCRVKGCVEIGRYYGLQQAICCRCGGSTGYATGFIPKWSKPDE